jgi:hypothetical protein
LQTVVLPIASGQERRNASNMIHRYSLCSWTFGEEQQAMVWRKKKLREKAKSCYFAIGLLRKQIFLDSVEKGKKKKTST